MKKLLAILLCLVMVLSLVACGKEPAVEPEEQGSDAEEVIVGPGGENPWVEYESLEEINNEVGCNLCKPAAMGVSEEHFTVGNMGEYKMAQYNFSVGGYAYTFRCAPDTKDISGLWYDEVQKAFAEPCGAEVETVTVPETLKVARWMTIDGQYVLSVLDNGELDEETFAGIVDELSQITMTDMFNENGENG